jgi:3-methylcrotonyl-CoA carboxylase alpha subunit
MLREGDLFDTLLIANRGEIACRIIRTARRMGIRTVAVFSDADAGALHVREADEAVRIGPAPARESYLRGDIILEAAARTGAQAIHPGYGFLSENPDFSRACKAAGIAFVGPSAEAIEAMGLKDRAKAVALAAGAPVLPGYWEADQSQAVLVEAARSIGFPLLVKAVAGGGGRGIRLVNAPDELVPALAAARREAAAAFGDDRVMLEKLVQRPRHLEVQVFGDTHGTVLHLFERDCSLQRRRQKLIEEAPAPGMTHEVRAALTSAAVRIAKAVGYTNAGTVEFVADGTGALTPDGFWFLEMNTRLQVEHPVTEAVTSTDLVEWQLRVAAGEPLPCRQEDIVLNGHAIEARIVAEDADAGFLPSSGTLRLVGEGWHHWRDDVRVDAGYLDGDTVPDAYDSLLAKVIAHGSDREQARTRLSAALRSRAVDGLTCNAGYLARLIDLPVFASGAVHTGAIEDAGTALQRPAASDPRRTGLAALFAFARIEAIRQSGAGSAYSAASGWRLNAPASLWVELDVDGKPVRADIRADSQMLATQVDGATTVLSRYRLVTGTDWPVAGDVRLVNASGDVLVAARVTGSGVTLFEDGDAWHYRFSRAEAAAEAAEAGDDIKAPLPGKIAMVTVDVGAPVTRGQTLVVLEAMKMEHTLTAPRDGVIAELTVGEGRQVRAGDLLVRLAPDAAAS